VSALLLASLGTSPLTRTVLVILIASIVLLSVRVWNGSSSLVLPKPISLLFDGTIIVLVVLFFFFVIVRFKNLA
jgi:hypothetical protein